MRNMRESSGKGIHMSKMENSEVATGKYARVINQAL